MAFFLRGRKSGAQLAASGDRFDREKLCAFVARRKKLERPWFWHAGAASVVLATRDGEQNRGRMERR